MLTRPSMPAENPLMTNKKKKAWSEEAHLAMMAKAKIDKSILSITSPGTHLVPGDVQLGRNLTRRCNEFAADLKRRRPDKFGFWASLPLPDVEGSLREIEYALDVLNADGVVVLTNAHGVYLGDPVLEPVFKALNERRAVVFVHPTSPCVGNGTSSTRPAAPALPQYPNPMFEFLFDTARAVVNLFISGTMQRIPDVTFILSHAGGALTPLVARFVAFAGVVVPGSSPLPLESVKETLRSQFYFDLAGFAFPDQIHGLLPYVNASRLTYGSDYPYTAEGIVLDLVGVMDEEVPKVFRGCAARRAIYWENAWGILRRRAAGGTS
ncbi:6-methylsalicylate decarboxylase [Purpureocillium takamizusanense]|uniref:6-methylsalicylate decarboxylase n=1 Tax=Purpureocillium takamizusanense TaxID=2060973 RepID=A0A9Q8QGB7_9HYPO|nr:6-methylsalicylate decarboxylase [Purpureocillium takamizusanense]UNI18142.1 6-methylsalicylate decarboxylase [Purpureocillium takamizusanense]